MHQLVNKNIWKYQDAARYICGGGGTHGIVIGHFFPPGGTEYGPVSLLFHFSISGGRSVCNFMVCLLQKAAGVLSCVRYRAKALRELIPIYIYIYIYIRPIHRQNTVGWASHAVLFGVDNVECWEGVVPRHRSRFLFRGNPNVNMKFQHSSQG